MSDCKFEVNMSLYQQLLKNGTNRGIIAATEQAATDANRYVKYENGDLHGSIDVDYERNGLNVTGVISWNTDYALRQYYTGEPINHGKGEGPPHKQWAHYAESVHRKDWLLQMTKGFAEGLL